MEAAWAWRVLGLAPGAAPADVRRAFRIAAQLLHPDRVADLSGDVQAEAHRRMVELADAYRICAALAAGAPLPPPRAARAPEEPAPGPLRSGGLQAAALLADARVAAVRAEAWADARAAVTALEQVAAAWPGTVEGDAARVLLVTSPAAASALSARERAGHLVLVADPAARLDAWDSLHGRDELAVAQVVYAHPTADAELRARARQRLAELDDWSTLAADADPDVRRNAAAHLLLRDSRSLAERAPWLSRRERAAFDAEYAGWRARVAAISDTLASGLRDDLARADHRIREAFACR
ncbi:MAG TPA: J domain-containing protein [Mycobacteriales bacterium]|nr:J domain-containing protein [Mycobacteriales bacterium]